MRPRLKLLRPRTLANQRAPKFIQQANACQQTDLCGFSPVLSCPVFGGCSPFARPTGAAAGGSRAVAAAAANIYACCCNSSAFISVEATASESARGKLLMPAAAMTIPACDCLCDLPSCFFKKKIACLQAGAQNDNNKVYPM